MTSTTDPWETISVDHTCPECGRTFALSTLAAFPNPPVVCDECAVTLERERERLNREDERRRKAEEEHAVRCMTCIPEAYWTFDPSAAWHFGEIRDWIREHSGKSLYIGSPVSGIGKTRGACAVALELAADGEDVYWILTTEWCRETCRLMAADGQESERRVQRAKKVKLLIIDDLGTETITERAAELIYEVIDARTRSTRRRTWITSNCDGNDLAQHLRAVGRKTIRRIRDVCLAWTPREDEK